MDDVKTVTLESLIGEHVLDGVDLCTDRVKAWGGSFEDAEVIRFRLDGTVYTAVQDASDGYRSAMRDIFAEECEIKNAFPPIRVLASTVDDGNILELRDMVTGKVVVEVGTADADDYYPSFVAKFHPENMTTNAGK
jgi:hypothetical protein